MIILFVLSAYMLVTLVLFIKWSDGTPDGVGEPLMLAFGWGVLVIFALPFWHKGYDSIQGDQHEP